MAVRIKEHRGEKAQGKMEIAVPAKALRWRQEALHRLVVTVCGGRRCCDHRATVCLIDTPMIQRLSKLDAESAKYMGFA